MKQKKKLSKRLLAFIISVFVVAVVLSAILITNIFIPVKYLSAYLYVSTDKPQSGEMRISFIDVGDGDCTVIEFPDGKVALLDGGNGSHSNQLKIFRKFNSSKISKIDYLICASADKSRCGGLAEIVKYKTTEKIYAPLYSNTQVTQAYRDFRREVKNKNQDITELAYGTIGVNEEYGYYFFALYPPKSLTAGESDKVRSSAIWISYGGVSVFLLGNLKTEELLSLLDEYAINGFEINGHSIALEQCDIVKVADGGKESGKCSVFYDLIQAETAIISTDSDPDFKVLSDVGNFAGDNTYRTDKDGTITLSISNGSYTIKKER